MALNGFIQVNSERLWHWSARRLEPEILEINTYEVLLVQCTFDVEGRLTRIIAKETLYHRYTDGSLELAAKVLRWAATIAEQEELTGIHEGWK